MSYQIKFQNGYEIQVTDSGNGGRVTNSHGEIVFDGTYDAAAKYLSDRGVTRAKNRDSAAIRAAEAGR